MPKQLLLLILLVQLTSCAYKTLAISCFCDVSFSCDAYCCCDNECSVTLKSNWNNYTLCASDGYAIPLCSYYYNQTMHTHDLYQGLRVIYTIVKRLFCISKVNFVDPGKGFTSSTSDAQINVPSTTTSTLNPHIYTLASITNYGNLPLRGGMGVCGQYALRDMNNIQQGECRTLLSSTAAIASNPYLQIALLKQNNNLNNSLQVYHMNTASAPSQTTTAATTACTGATCVVVKQIVLFFIKTASSVTVNYSSSYVVVGSTVVTGSTYVYLKYSYQFLSQSGNFPYSSTIGYNKNTPLVLLKSSTTGTTTNYYKVFNPVNLGFVGIDGTCRTNSNSDSDHSNLITLKLGVNSVYTCLGSSLLAATNLKLAFDMVGSIGSASTTLADYIPIDFSPSASATNQNLQLVFYYVSIGTQSSPQYQITKAVLNPLSVNSNNQFSLFVEYVAVNTSLILNLPSPPILDAYLPDDFLYPFYVAE